MEHSNIIMDGDVRHPFTSSFILSNFIHVRTEGIQYYSTQLSKAVEYKDESYLTPSLPSKLHQLDSLLTTSTATRQQCAATIYPLSMAAANPAIVPVLA